MKRFTLLLLTVIVSCASFAQTSRKIQQLEARRKELSKQIVESQSLLNTTNRDVKSQLSNLAAINGQIADRKKYIAVIESDVNTLDNSLQVLKKELAKLENDLTDKKEKYKYSVQYLHRNKTIQEKLMFIFSADDLLQTYRRLRYVQEYANFQRRQAKEIARKQKAIRDKQNEIMQTREEKQKLLSRGLAEKAKLEIQEKDRQTLLSKLRTKQKDIRQELNQRKKLAQQLNNEIDRLVAIEVEKARKRAEEEARRQAEAEALAARKEEAKRKSKSKSRRTETKSNDLAENKSNAGGKSTAEKSKSAETFNLNTVDRQLSGTFERNQGLLPVPVTGPYLIVSHYGRYQVDGLRNVSLDNKGIDIKAQKGAQARAIFDGEVSAVFQYNGLSNVLIRHGKYISVYCNLSSVNVTRGSKIKTRTPIGQIHTDTSGNTILHFQLRRETTKLNPESWIGR